MRCTALLATVAALCAGCGDQRSGTPTADELHLPAGLQVEAEDINCVDQDDQPPACFRGLLVVPEDEARGRYRTSKQVVRAVLGGLRDAGWTFIVATQPIGASNDDGATAFVDVRTPSNIQGWTAALTARHRELRAEETPVAVVFVTPRRF